MTDTLGLSDADYWTAPLQTLDAVFARLCADRKDGVVLIGAPATVALDARQTLPVVVYRAGSYRDLRALDFAQRALLVDVDLDWNHVRVVRAIEPQGPPEPPADGPVPNGYLASPVVLDARERLGLAWQPGAHRLSIVMRDRVSNPVRVSLGTSPDGYRDEAVASFIAAARGRPRPPELSPAPGQPLPCYERLDASPPVPAEPGVALRVQRVAVLPADGGARCPLAGSFRLQALPVDLVPPAAQPPGAGDPRRPTAIVRIALLMTGADTGAWRLLELCVPSFDKITPGDRAPVVTGHFAFDLVREAPHLAKVAETHFLYAISGEVFEGPTPFAFVAEELVRAR